MLENGFIESRKNLIILTVTGNLLGMLCIRVAHINYVNYDLKCHVIRENIDIDGIIRILLCSMFVSNI